MEKEPSMWIVYAQALISSVTVNTIIPLAILALIFFVIWRLLWMAQHKPDFHIEKLLEDSTGKASCGRFISLMAFAFSSWYLAVEVLNRNADANKFLYYLIAWSGAKALSEFAGKWDGALPLSNNNKPAA